MMFIAVLVVGLAASAVGVPLGYFALGAVGYFVLAALSGDTGR